jgi:hypothetical protein
MMSQLWVRRPRRAVVVLASSKHLEPLGEGEVDSDVEADGLLELAHQVEEKRAAVLWGGQVAEFIE